MSQTQADESAQNLLEGLPPAAPQPPSFSPAYSRVLAACGAAGFAWKLLAAQIAPTLPLFPNAVLALACACWFCVFLRAIRSPAAPLATRCVSVALALWFPLGSAAFLYWLLRVRSADTPAKPS